MVSKVRRGNSLAVQWLGVGTFTARAWVQSLVRELRSRKPQKGAAKKKEKKSGEWLPFIGVGGSEGGLPGADYTGAFTLGKFVNSSE